MTVRYRCNSTSQVHSFNGTDQQLIRQLPSYIQKEFPAILTNASGILMKLAKLMRPLFQCGVGPHRLNKILRILHTEHFDELQFQYYDKILERIKNPTLFDLQRNSEQQSSMKFDEFSRFNDKAKFSGYIPSANYLSCAYSSFIQESVPYMDQLNSMIDGVILKGGHSFKLIKHMGKANGTPVFSAVYTLRNEYEEIRMQVLAHTKSLNGLKTNFRSMMESYNRYGFEMPEVFYTDNVTRDKNILEKLIPSLLRDVQPLSFNKSGSNGNNSSPSNSQLPLATSPESIQINVCDTIDSVNEACQKVLSETGENEINLGFDCE